MTKVGRAVAVLLAVAIAAPACGGEATGTSSPVTLTSTAPPITTITAVTTAPDTSGPTESETTAPSTSSTVPAGLPTIPSIVAVPPTLEGRPLAWIAVDGEPLLVAIAETRAARRQGLMAVTDLLDLDGMLFTWPSDTSGGFWMRDTVLPLDIAFFDAAGRLVVTFPMEPCDLGAQCPTYDPDATYRYALETEQGRLGELAPDTTLTLPEDVGGSR